MKRRHTQRSRSSKGFSSETEFTELDGIIDAGVGASAAEKQLRGRVKYSTAQDRLYIYLAHQ